MAQTHDQVIRRIDVGWLETSSTINVDVEATDGFRRYLGMRWSLPKPRKSGGRRNKQDSNDEASSQHEPKSNESSVLRPGKNLAGFVAGEWDIKGGTY